MRHLVNHDAPPTPEGWEGVMRGPLEDAPLNFRGWGIRGFHGVTLLDFPGRVASIVFFGGCTFRCPFCHNPWLVLPSLIEEQKELPLSMVLHEVDRRRNLVSGVVVSGGEPTLQDNLLSFLEALKGLGLAVKLDTNGSRPQVLEEALKAGLVDLVAMDIKTSPSRYPQVTGGGDFGSVGESLEVLKAWAPRYILRTTLVPGLVGKEEMGGIAHLVEGTQEYHLQPFRNSYTLDPSFSALRPYPPSIMEEMARILEGVVEKVVRCW